MGNELQIRVLGNVEIRRDGVRETIGGPKPRQLLAMLVAQWLSLRHVFGILCQLEADRTAATLHGALAAVGAVHALPFVATDAEQITKRVGTLREHLGSAEFAAAVRRGAAMGDSEIVEFIRGRIAVLATP